MQMRMIPIGLLDCCSFFIGSFCWAISIWFGSLWLWPDSSLTRRFSATNRAFVWVDRYESAHCLINRAQCVHWLYQVSARNWCGLYPNKNIILLYSSTLSGRKESTRRHYTYTPRVCESMHFNIYKYEHDLHIAKRREWEAACDRFIFSLRSLLCVCASVLSSNENKKDKEDDITKRRREKKKTESEHELLGSEIGRRVQRAFCDRTNAVKVIFIVVVSG